jgi:hypothetical protein
VARIRAIAENKQGKLPGYMLSGHPAAPNLTEDLQREALRKGSEERMDYYKWKMEDSQPK